MVRPRNGLIGVVDLGTTKACCFIARAEGARGLRVIGIGHQASGGVRGGVIVDMDAAETAIINAVHAAEQMAGETVREVLVSFSGGRLHSETVTFEVPLGAQEIADSDVRRVLAQGRAAYASGAAGLLHAIPLSYTIDGSRGIRDPRGMYGERLGVNLHLVTGPAGAMRNLATCVNRAHLDIEGFAAAPYAAGLACLVDDEMDLGVTVVEMGGGTTTIAVFYNGDVIHTDTVPLGGGHVTNDIARGLSTPLAHAERMKTLYGHALASSADVHEVIDVPQVGEDTASQTNHIPKSLLVGIIQPRLEETFELVRSRIEAGGFDKEAFRRVVLTGGASQLQGVRELAGLVLDRQVRIGRPIRVGGLAEATSGPAFAVCAGMLTYAIRQPAAVPAAEAPSRMAQVGVLYRIGAWLRANF